MANDASDSSGMGRSEASRIEKKEEKMSVLMDMFTPDEKIELKHSEYYELMKEAVKAELLSDALKAEVPGCYIHAMITGEKVTFDEAEMDSEVATWAEVAGVCEKMFKKAIDKEHVTEIAEQIRRLTCVMQDQRLYELDFFEKEARKNADSTDQGKMV